MIDFHCHILPMLDDGSKSWDESLEMARIAASDGIDEIVCTPHYKTGWLVPPASVIAETTRDLQARLCEAGIPVRVHQGTEAGLELLVADKVRRGRIATLGGGSVLGDSRPLADGRADGGPMRYLLLELPWTGFPKWTLTVISELLALGVVPVIAHAERYRETVSDADLVRAFVERGALVQVNSGSVTGFFGDAVRRTAEVLLTHRLVHVIGSDAHSAGSRCPRMAQARAIIADLLGEDSADRLTRLNASKILAGEVVPTEDPLPVAGRGRGRHKGRLSRILKRA